MRNNCSGPREIVSRAVAPGVPGGRGIADAALQDSLVDMHGDYLEL